MLSTTGKLDLVAKRLTPAREEPGLMTVAEVATWLGVSQQTVRAWCDKGRIPHFRVEGNIRFDPEDLEAWLRERYRPATAD